MTETYNCGKGGCAASTKRRGTLRFCQQKAISTYHGKGYCFYHNPLHPRKFGEKYKEGTNEPDTSRASDKPDELQLPD